MAKKMTKCSCGSTTFIVDEGLAHHAELVDGSLDVYKCRDNEIMSINCVKCDKKYDESDFEQIDFC